MNSRITDVVDYLSKVAPIGIPLIVMAWKEVDAKIRAYSPEEATIIEAVRHAYSEAIGTDQYPCHLAYAEHKQDTLFEYKFPAFTPQNIEQAIDKKRLGSNFIRNECESALRELVYYINRYMAKKCSGASKATINIFQVLIDLMYGLSQADLRDIDTLKQINQYIEFVSKIRAIEGIERRMHEDIETSADIVLDHVLNTLQIDIKPLIVHQQVEAIHKLEQVHSSLKTLYHSGFDIALRIGSTKKIKDIVSLRKIKHEKLQTVGDEEIRQFAFESQKIDKTSRRHFIFGLSTSLTSAEEKSGAEQSRFFVKPKFKEYLMDKKSDFYSPLKSEEFISLYLRYCSDLEKIAALTENIRRSQAICGRGGNITYFCVLDVAAEALIIQVESVLADLEKTQNEMLAIANQQNTNISHKNLVARTFGEHRRWANLHMKNMRYAGTVNAELAKLKEACQKLRELYAYFSGDPENAVRELNADCHALKTRISEFQEVLRKEKYLPENAPMIPEIRRSLALVRSRLNNNNAPNPRGPAEGNSAVGWRQYCGEDASTYERIVAAIPLGREFQVLNGKIAEYRVALGLFIKSEADWTGQYEAYVALDKELKKLQETSANQQHLGLLFNLRVAFAYGQMKNLASLYNKDNVSKEKRDKHKKCLVDKFSKSSATLNKVGNFPLKHEYKKAIYSFAYALETTEDLLPDNEIFGSHHAPIIIAGGREDKGDIPPAGFPNPQGMAPPPDSPGRREAESLLYGSRLPQGGLAPQGDLPPQEPSSEVIFEAEAQYQRSLTIRHQMELASILLFDELKGHVEAGRFGELKNFLEDTIWEKNSRMRATALYQPVYEAFARQLIALEVLVCDEMIRAATTWCNNEEKNPRLGGPRFIMKAEDFTATLSWKPDGIEELIEDFQSLVSAQEFCKIFDGADSRDRYIAHYKARVERCENMLQSMALDCAIFVARTEQKMARQIQIQAGDLSAVRRSIAAFEQRKRDLQAILSQESENERPSYNSEGFLLSNRVMVFLNRWLNGLKGNNFYKMAKEYAKAHLIPDYKPEEKNEEPSEIEMQAVIFDALCCALSVSPLSCLRDGAGNTLMHFAIRKYTFATSKDEEKVCLEIIELLYKNGADALTQNKERPGMTPQDAYAFSGIPMSQINAIDGNKNRKLWHLKMLEAKYLFAWSPLTQEAKLKISEYTAQRAKFIESHQLWLRFKKICGLKVTAHRRLENVDTMLRHIEETVASLDEEQFLNYLADPSIPKGFGFTSSLRRITLDLSKKSASGALIRVSYAMSKADEVRQINTILENQHRWDQETIRELRGKAVSSDAEIKRERTGREALEEKLTVTEEEMVEAKELVKSKDEEIEYLRRQVEALKSSKGQPRPNDQREEKPSPRGVGFFLPAPDLAPRNANPHATPPPSPRI